MCNIVTRTIVLLQNSSHSLEYNVNSYKCMKYYFTFSNIEII